MSEEIINFVLMFVAVIAGVLVADLIKSRFPAL